jgi:hypothetical protein
MVKTYKIVPNPDRLKLIYLIHNMGMTITDAARATKIYYPTAKAINKIYTRELRVDKKAHRFPRKRK